jgi:hypothetical protein
MELSSDMWKFISSGGDCPKCHRRLTLLYVAPRLAAPKAWTALGGFGPVRPVKEAIPQLIGPNVGVRRFIGVEFLDCKYCGKSWSVLKLEAPRSTALQGIGLIKRAPQPVTVDLSNSRIVRIRETTRKEEPAGEESYDFGQSGTTASAVETIGLSHTTEWAVTIDTARARTTGGNAELRLVGVASVRGNIDATLTKKYSATWRQSISRQQSTAVTIPAGKRVRVTVRWKRIWQEGEVDLRTPTGTIVTLPFRVTIMLGFDKETVDLK